MDPLEDIFTAMRVESALYARLEAQAPWGISFACANTSRFAIVVRGHCWLSSPDLPQPIALTGGDCFIAQARAEFELRDAPNSPLVECTTLFTDEKAEVVRTGGDGARSEIVAGRFAFDSQGGEPLMAMLPPILAIRMDKERAQLLQATLQLIAMETAEQAMGGRMVVNRLADVLFVQAVRAYAQSGAAPKTGWLAALSDRSIGAALRAMHGDLAHPWTVERLASVAGMSRSAFAHHFKATVGDTPLNYLTHWRMFRAQTLLRQEGMALSEVAGQVGYETDAAFHRAFKRAVGITPGVFRRQAATTTVDSAIATPSTR